MKININHKYAQKAVSVCLTQNIITAVGLELQKSLFQADALE